MNDNEIIVCCECGKTHDIVGLDGTNATVTYEVDWQGKPKCKRHMVEYWIEELEGALEYHKDHKKWDEPDFPFQHIAEYNKVLDWQDEVARLREELKKLP